MKVITTVQDLLRALGALDPPCFMFGGMAEDALLDGDITRPHSDIDVVVPRHDLDLRLEQFRSWGYEEWDIWLSDSAGNAQVLHSSGHPVELELAIFEGEPGAYWFEFETPAGGHVRYFPPADMLAHRPVEIQGISVRTVTPHMLYVTRAALVEIGSFGPARPKDLAVQPRLRALLDGVEEADLVPRLETTA